MIRRRNCSRGLLAIAVLACLSACASPGAGAPPALATASFNLDVRVGVQVQIQVEIDADDEDMSAATAWVKEVPNGDPNPVWVDPFPGWPGTFMTQVTGSNRWVTNFSMEVDTDKYRAVAVYAVAKYKGGTTWRHIDTISIPPGSQGVVAVMANMPGF